MNVRPTSAQFNADACLARAVTGGDCDDTRATAHPGAAELCNARDDDCERLAHVASRAQNGRGFETPRRFIDKDRIHAKKRKWLV